MKLKTLLLLLAFSLAALVASGCGAAEPPTEPVKPGIIRGSLSKAVIRKVVHAQIGMIKQCANTYGRPGESGKLGIKFIIRAAGNVTDAEIVGSTLANERLEKCVLAAPQYWHFPPPDGGGIVFVTYPFTIEMPAEGGAAPSVSHPGGSAAGATPAPAPEQATP
jgi:TonB family protein